VNDSLAFERRLLENAFLAMQQHRKKDGTLTTQSRNTIKIQCSHNCTNRREPKRQRPLVQREWPKISYVHINGHPIL
jgi:hypothetical protein